MEDEVIYQRTGGITNSVIGKMFFWMFMGLLATGIASWYCFSSGYVMNLSFSLLIIIELVFVVGFTISFKKLPAIVVTLLYFAYAVLNGFTMSVIFYAFELNSIITLFFVTAGIFGILAFIGMYTEVDLTRFRNILTIGLIAGIIISLINLILNNSALDIVLDWAMLALFLGITVYDVNNIKNMDNLGIMEPDKLYIYGAMEIYLDFINIFIRLLSLFGRSRD